MLKLPGVELTAHLGLRVGTAEVRLTPENGCALAMALLRNASRRAVIEEAEAPRSLAERPRLKARRPA